MPREFDDLDDGTELEPFHLNIIYRELKRLRKMTASAPLMLDGMESSEETPEFSASGSLAGTYAFTKESISARSGTTLGTGTIDTYFDDGTGVLEVDEEDVDVKNYSGMAIDADKYCWVVRDWLGEWVVISVEC